MKVVEREGNERFLIIEWDFPRAGMGKMLFIREKNCWSIADQ